MQTKEQRLRLPVEPDKTSKAAGGTHPEGDA